MGFRRSFTGWVGALTVLFGIGFIVLSPALSSFTVGIPALNHAVAIPLWAGVLLIMSGLAVVVEVIGRKKRSTAYTFLRFPLVSLMANLVSFILACVIIALLTWALYDNFLQNTGRVAPNFRGQILSMYATMIFMAAMILMLTLFAMFMDCCASFLVVPTAANDYPPGPPAIYDHHRPAVIYK